MFLHSTLFQCDWTPLELTLCKAVRLLQAAVLHDESLLSFFLKHVCVCDLSFASYHKDVVWFVACQVSHFRHVSARSNSLISCWFGEQPRLHVGTVCGTSCIFSSVCRQKDKERKSRLSLFLTKSGSHENVSPHKKTNTTPSKWGKIH